jgi:hypothetical protein
MGGIGNVDMRFEGKEDSGTLGERGRGSQYNALTALSPYS